MFVSNIIRITLLTKEILFQSYEIDDKELNKLEVEFIRKFNSNNPMIGYNQWPKFIK